MNIIFRNKTVIVLLLSAVMILVSGAAAATAIRELSIDEILEIRLFENPSTGYRWKLDYVENKSLQLLQEEYQSLAENSEKNENDQSQAEKDGTQILVGQGGIKSWTFRGLEEGHQLLTFELKRSGSKAEKTVKYLVLVD